MPSLINLSTLDLIILCLSLAATLMWAIDAALFIIVWKMVSVKSKSSKYILALCIISFSMLITELFRAYTVIAGNNTETTLAVIVHAMILLAGIMLFILLNGKARVENVGEHSIIEAADIVRTARVVEMAGTVKTAEKAELVKETARIEAAEVVEKATVVKETERVEAIKQAKIVVKAAKIEAASVVEEAKTEAAGVVDEARAEAAVVVEEARAGAAVVVEEAALVKDAKKE